jgi:hypothetical protein
MIEPRFAIVPGNEVFYVINLLEASSVGEYAFPGEAVVILGGCAR